MIVASIFDDRPSINMLEEVIALCLSLCSLFLNETPSVSFREQISGTINTEEGATIAAHQWPSYISKEYEIFHPNEELNSPLVGRETIAHTRLGRAAEQRSFWKSVRKSIRTSLSTAFAVLPLAAVTMIFLYFDLKTSDLCVEWVYHNNTLPFSVKRLRVIGEGVETILINLWFPLTIIVLFGWKDFKQRFFSIFYIGLIFGEASMIYYHVLLGFGIIARTHVSYRLPANVLYYTGIICCSIIIVRNIRGSGSYTVSSYSNSHIIVLISTELFASSLLSIAYRYAIVPSFNSIKEEHYKFLAAAVTPGLTIIPAAICKHIALRRSSEVVHPARSFVLVYIIRGGVIYIYRIMQAEFKSIWLFIGLSLFSSVLNFLKKATHRVRMKLWRYIISLMRRTVCCRRINEMPCNTPHFRRLRADLEIQDMVFEYSSMISSQGYLVLYHLESFELSTSFLLFESLKRVAIGLGIDFFFNCLSNFVQIHYYNIPIARVWTKCWKRHMLANFIIVIVIVSYFTQALLSVFQARETGTKQYLLRNCTLF